MVIARGLTGMDCSLAPLAPYGSTHDGERYELHLCESCFFMTISGLRRERMLNFMFSDDGQDLNAFGRVARDDFLNEGGE
tara:strand:+ start:1331 stop:1570 length:240 start_codon:yes stop_codon:yes gene_type:complete